jgi:hypothetical protein
MTPVALIAIAFFLFELMFPAETDRGELYFRTEPDVMPKMPEQNSRRTEPEVMPRMPEQNPPESAAAVE